VIVGKGLPEKRPPTKRHCPLRKVEKQQKKKRRKHKRKKVESLEKRPERAGEA